MCRMMYMTHSKGEPRVMSGAKSDILNECHNFLATLYKEKDVQLGLADFFCDSVSKISDEQCIDCDRPIDSEELGGGCCLQQREVHNPDRADFQ